MPLSGVGQPSTDDVDPSLLESLEESTSSSDIPKSKLDYKVRKEKRSGSDGNCVCIHSHMTIILLLWVAVV